MADTPSVIHSDPGVSGGIPVFRGTRVPVQSLFDYLEGGETLDQFLDQFPSVTRQQALAALDLARNSVLARARSPRVDARDQQDERRGCRRQTCR